MIKKNRKKNKKTKKHQSEDFIMYSWYIPFVSGDTKWSPVFPAPALCPATVMRLTSPLKYWMLELTHSIASTWSKSPLFPEKLFSTDDKNPIKNQNFNFKIECTVAFFFITILKK